MRKNKTTNLMAGVFMILFVVLFLILAGRFMYIQATGEVNGVSLQTWADQQRTAQYTIEAERGKIFDKNGMSLAYDRPTYRLYAIVNEAYSEKSEKPLHVEDARMTAEKLAPLLGVEVDDILEPLEQGIEKGRFQVEFGKVGKHLSQSLKDEINEMEIPGINFQEEAIRYYPNGMFASHIIGFAREATVERDGVEMNEITGVTGIEQIMNDLLGGKQGHISYQRDRYNTKLLDPNELIQMPEDGDDVYLTIDQKIQTLLEDVLSQVQKEYNPEKMNAIVMNPKTGEVLAMSSRPSYDPNDPSDVQNWYNDTISTPFEPGSTIKMFTWAAAIEEGVYDGKMGFKSGDYQVNERISAIHDHNQGKGWGTISFDEGFQRSSNVAAAKLAWENLGTETFLEYLESFDFDKPTGIDLPGEVTGQILYNWPLEKITTSFGQGSTTTPIQQLKAATAIANGGNMMKPYVIDRVVDSTSGEILEQHEPEAVGKPISENTADQVLSLLESVVTGEHGTGKAYKLNDYTVGGKTGTAEIPNPEGGGYLTGRENYVFSFLGMAPIEDPKLIMYVSVQQPELEEDQVGADPVSFIFKNVVENSLHYLNIDPDTSDSKAVESYELPQLEGEDISALAETLKAEGVTVTQVGKEGKVITANYEKGDKVLPGERVLLIGEKALMPYITGWSLRDVMQFSQMMKLKTETFGNGYVDTQNIEPGTALKEGDYLGVEFIPPDETDPAEQQDGSESEEDSSE